MISKRTLLGPIILLLIIVTGYPIYWLYMASASEALINNWIKEQKLFGFTVSHRDLETSGFPFFIQLSVEAPEAINAAAGFAWRSKKLKLYIQPWDLRRFRLEALEPQQISFRDSAETANFNASAARLEGIAHTNKTGSLTALSIVVKDMRLSKAGLGLLLQASQISANLRRPDTPPIKHTHSALNLTIAAERINLTTPKTAVLGDTISNIDIKAELMGPLAGRTVPDALSAWRQSGGTLEIHQLNMVWGSLDLRTLGTFSLDPGMRPLGALTADIRGYEAMLEALAEANLIRSDILPASRFTLNLLAKNTEAGKRRVLTVPLTAQGGGLYLGPIKLTELPVLFTPPLNRPSTPQD